MAEGIRPVNPQYGTPATIQPPDSPTPQAPFVPVTLDVQQGATNLPAGVSPVIYNFTVTPEGLVPRSGLSIVGPVLGTGSLASAVGANPIDMIAEHPVASLVGGTGAPPVDFNDTVVLSGATVATFARSVWTAVSLSTFSPGTTQLVAGLLGHSSTVFDQVAENNGLVITQLGTGNQPVIFRSRPGAGGVFSVSRVTNAPTGGTVAYFDSRAVFGNVKESNTQVESEVAWGDRGDIYTYAAPNGGAEDIVSLRGPIVRIVEDSDRILVFSTREIWVGYKIAFPFTFEFRPLDRTMGSPHPCSIVRTPRGVVFLGYDNNVYLLPAGGAKAVPVGDRLQPQLSRAVYAPSAYSFNRTAATYDPWRQEYLLLPHGFSSTTGTRQGYVLNMQTGAWSTVSYGVELCYALSTAASWSSVPLTLLGSSGGTVYMVPSAGSGRESFVTSDAGSAYSAAALFPIGNPNPSEKLYVRDLLIDYSNFTALSGSSITIACSADFGQTYDLQIGVALPHATVSRQTVVNLGYTATYPSIEVRYESQKTGTALRLRRLTAIVAPVGMPGVS